MKRIPGGEPPRGPGPAWGDSLSPPPECQGGWERLIGGSFSGGEEGKRGGVTAGSIFPKQSASKNEDDVTLLFSSVICSEALGVSIFTCCGSDRGAES